MSDEMTIYCLNYLRAIPYLKKIPFFVRGHATEKTCGLFAREFPDLYNSFKGEPTEEQKEEMKKLINLIFEERMAKHDM